MSQDILPESAKKLYLCLVMRDLTLFDGILIGAVIAVGILLYGVYCGWRNQRRNK